jgi:hypothetical protein
MPPAQHWDNAPTSRDVSVGEEAPGLRPRAILLLMSSTLMAVLQSFAAGHLVTATGEDAITDDVASWHAEAFRRWHDVCETLGPLAENLCTIVNAEASPSFLSDCVAIVFASLVIALTVAEESAGARRVPTVAPPSVVPPRSNQLAG